MDTAEESQLIFQYKELIGMPPSYWFWTGVIKENNQWIYDDGQQVTFVNWYPGEPNYDGNCVYAWSLQALQWYDDSCNDHRWVLCEA